MIKNSARGKQKKSGRESKSAGLITSLFLFLMKKQLLAEALIALFILSFTVSAYSMELTASWYSVESLKKEGTWKTSKGVMANGKKFDDQGFTCATRLFPLGSVIIVANRNNGKKVYVKVTDRIGKRFAKKRIDLSKRAFSKLAMAEQGVIPVTVEYAKKSY